jgi:polysaccharide export outer membrane protein
MIRGLLVSAIAMMGLVAGGCDGPRGAISGADAMASAQQAPIYRLSPGDKVKVTVFNEPDLTGEFQVNDSGNVALPLAGEVNAVGLTLSEFKTGVIRTLRGRYVKNPRVAVEMVNYRPFNVIGEVRNAGQYPYRPGLTVQDAVAMAGGYTYRANTRVLYVRRADSGGESTVQMDGGSATVSPGDNIRVPERYF